MPANRVWYVRRTRRRGRPSACRPLSGLPGASWCARPPGARWSCPRIFLRCMPRWWRTARDGCGAPTTRSTRSLPCRRPTGSPGGSCRARRRGGGSHCRATCPCSKGQSTRSGAGWPSHRMRRSMSTWHRPTGWQAGWSVARARGRHSGCRPRFRRSMAWSRTTRPAPCVRPMCPPACAWQSSRPIGSPGRSWFARRRAVACGCRMPCRTWWPYRCGSVPVSQPARSTRSTARSPWRVRIGLGRTGSSARSAAGRWCCPRSCLHSRPW